MNSSNQTEKLLSISVVSHGQKDLVHRLVKSIHENEDYKNIELIITENTQDEPISISEIPFPNTRLFINTQPMGFATNHNRALREAQGEYFCLLNPDVIFKEAIFNRLIRDLDLNRGQIVAPLVLDSEMNLQDSFRKIPTVFDLLGRRIQEHPISITADGEFIYPHWIAGIFLLMERGTYTLLEGLDENFYLYF
jgi:GT2 family glycosyltransferase